MTRRPLPILAALILSGTIAFAQTPPPAAAPAPAPQAGPGQAPSGPGRGMSPGMRPNFRQGMQQGRPGVRAGGMQSRRKGQNNFRSGAMHGPGGGGFRGGPGGFHGAPGGGFRGAEGGGMSASLRIGPTGMWWKNPGIVQKLTLTPDQTKKMDDIFQVSRLDLIDKKATVEKANATLEPLLSANPVDTVKALAQIDKVARARADLEMANAKMLLGIRGVLTPDQWTKLHTSGLPVAVGAPPAASTPPAGPGGPGGGRGRGPRGAPPATGGNFAPPNPQP